MDILFKNSTVRTKDFLKESHRYACFKKGPMLYLLILIIVYWLGLLALSISTGNYNIVTLAIPPLCIFYIVFRYIATVNAYYKRDIELYGKEAEIEVTVTDEFIEYATPSSVNKVDISKIKRVTQTKNLILVLTKANVGYVFDKNGFTVGSKDEFIDFLKSKGITVKGK